MSISFSEIQLKKVRKVFGRHPVLSGITFRLRAGRISLMMGPNGAGKSTMISILSTLSRPTSGEVLFGDHDHAFAEARLRGRIGLVSHESMLYSKMSARENLLFFSRMHGVATPDEAVATWIDRMEIARPDEPVGHLSRGMTQRVSLARSLIHDPDLILMDEPFTGLDRDARENLRETLRAVVRRDKIMLVVTHDAAGVDGLCGQLLVLGRGRLVLDHADDALAADEIRELVVDAS